MTPVLYILMRTDLPSMNAGKAMAQASHASNAFVHRKENKGTANETVNKAYDLWKNETGQGFGTVLVLGCNREELTAIIDNVKGVNDVMGEEVIDPTYPYQVTGEIANLLNPDMPIYKGDGLFVLTRQEITCGYVFGDKEGSAGALVGKLKLHP